MPRYKINPEHDGTPFWVHAEALESQKLETPESLLAHRLFRYTDEEIFPISASELKIIEGWPGWNVGGDPAVHPLVEVVEEEEVEESPDCTACKGTGEGKAGGACAWCHGRGYDKPEPEPDYDTLEERDGYR